MSSGAIMARAWNASPSLTLAVIHAGGIVLVEDADASRYNACKTLLDGYALESFTFLPETGDAGIRRNVVAPGYSITHDVLRGDDPASIHDLARAIIEPEQPIYTPRSLADTIIEKMTARKLPWVLLVSRKLGAFHVASLEPSDKLLPAFIISEALADGGIKQAAFDQEGNPDQPGNEWAPVAPAVGAVNWKVTGVSGGGFAAGDDPEQFVIILNTATFDQDGKRKDFEAHLSDENQTRGLPSGIFAVAQDGFPGVSEAWCLSGGRILLLIDGEIPDGTFTMECGPDGNERTIEGIPMSKSFIRFSVGNGAISALEPVGMKWTGDDPTLRVGDINGQHVDEYNTLEVYGLLLNSLGEEVVDENGVTIPVTFGAPETGESIAVDFDNIKIVSADDPANTREVLAARTQGTFIEFDFPACTSGKWLVMFDASDNQKTVDEQVGCARFVLPFEVPDPDDQ